MTRLAIIVEGHTERRFVNAILAEHLRNHGVETTPILIGTTGGHRGGNVSVDRLAHHLVRVRWNFDAVTSLVDFYGFRRKADATVEELEVQIEGAVATKGGPAGGHRVVVPYVQKYEFEALLFSDVSPFGELKHAPEGVVAALRSVRDRFQTPEDINDGRETAPSKRIRAVMPRFDKARQGHTVAGHIGLPKIRAECPRFDDWVRRLEALGAEPPAVPG